MSITIEMRSEHKITSSGEKTQYIIDVFDDTTGQVKESFSTANGLEAIRKMETLDVKYGTNTAINMSDFDTIQKDHIKTDYELLNQSMAAVTPYGELTYGSFTPRASADPGFNDRRTKPVLNTSQTFKKAVDLSGLNAKRYEMYGKSQNERIDMGVAGVHGDRREQPRITRRFTPCELGGHMRGADNNAFIIIGNDRVSKFHTGYGGKGHTQCDAIDLVAGMGGHSPKEESESNSIITDWKKKKGLHPNFFLDAARIYISQKTDVDKNFGIGEFGKAEDDNRDNKDDKYIGQYGAKSAIAIKADNIRLVGRESIRLVTGTDKFNSQGGEVLSKSGIELVAMNDVKSLQPLVLGDNLGDALDNIVHHIQSLTEIFHAYVKYQMKFNHEVGKHKHEGFFYIREGVKSKPTAAADIQLDIETAAKTELSVLKQITNLQGFKNNFLFPSGKSYIKSRLNKVN